MKKFFSVVLVSAMVVLTAFTGCSENDTSNGSSQTTSKHRMFNRLLLRIRLILILKKLRKILKSRHIYMMMSQHITLLLC